MGFDDPPSERGRAPAGHAARRCWMAETLGLRSTGGSERPGRPGWLAAVLGLAEADGGAGRQGQRARRLGQMLRSAAAGLAGGMLDLLILALLVELFGMVPAVATVASALAGALVNFFLNRGWAFRSRGPLLRQGGHYVLATTVWVALSAIVVHLCVGIVRIPYLLARIVADVAVFLGWGFPASRWIFRPRDSA